MPERKTVTKSEAIEIANDVFDRKGCRATGEDVADLAETVIELEGRGLGKLIDNLKQRKIGDFFAEINVARMLVSRHPPEVSIEYEPDVADQSRRVDFRIVIGPKTYWLQVKAYAALERDNRHSKIMDRIKTCAKGIQVGKYFDLRFTGPATFSPDRIPELVNFLSEQAQSAGDREKKYFPNRQDAEVEVEFWTDSEVQLSHLTSAIHGDAGTVNVTGFATNQIRESLRNAAGAFNWEGDANTINLIVTNADNQDIEDISEAVYGTDSGSTKCGPHVGRTLRISRRWARAGDGLFQEAGFSEKVAGVLAMRKKLSVANSICACYVRLFVNERFQTHIETICELLPVDKVLHYDTFPEDENFEFQ